MEFSELVRKRRSIRRFKIEPVPDEYVERIVEVAMFSPSARNRRPVHLVIVRDREMICELRDLRPGAFAFLETSPLAIVVVSENVDTWESDSAIVAYSIQLCATDLGLGSCWGHIVNRVENEVREILNIPGDKRILCVIGVGFPDEDKPPHTPDEVDPERVHLNGW